MKFELMILDDRITQGSFKPKTPGSAGIDLVASCWATATEYSRNQLLLVPGQVAMIGTGIAIHIKDPGYAAMILPRSGAGHKGLVLGNLVGLIDSDYQGEIKVSAWNRSSNPIIIKPMDRIAQLVLFPIVVPEFVLVDSFGESLRGEGSFGSTGR